MPAYVMWNKIHKKKERKIQQKTNKQVQNLYLKQYNKK